MLEKLKGKECKFVVASYSDTISHIETGILEDYDNDFIRIKTKKNIQYISIKAITYIVEL